jgi:hypothetical protein
MAYSIRAFSGGCLHLNRRCGFICAGGAAFEVRKRFGRRFGADCPRLPMWLVLLRNAGQDRNKTRLIGY